MNARLSALPPAGIVAAQIGRGIFLWVLTRVGLMLVMRQVIIELPAPAALFVAAAVAALALVDARVMREPLFHANLGVPSWLTPALAAATALMLEVAVWIIA